MALIESEVFRARKQNSDALISRAHAEYNATEQFLHSSERSSQELAFKWLFSRQEKTITIRSIQDIRMEGCGYCSSENGTIDYTL